MVIIFTAAQIILGIFLVLGKADIKTLGWYYIVAGSLMLLCYAILGLVALQKTSK